MAMTVAELDVFLSQPHVAVLATCDSEQRPHQVPIWYLWCGGAALLLTARESKKWRNILENPHVSLCVDTKEAPYLAAVLHGETEEAPEMDLPVVTAGAGRSLSGRASRPALRGAEWPQGFQLQRCLPFAPRPHRAGGLLEPPGGGYPVGDPERSPLLDRHR